MAADSLVTLGDRRIPTASLAVQKIRQVGEALVALAGWNVYDDVLTDYLTSRRGVRLKTRTEVFAFFNEFWKALHKDYAFVNDSVEASDSPFGSLDSTFLVQNASGIFVVTSDMGVLPFDRFYAIGSGAPYSLGALEAIYDSELDAEAIARQAVDIAIRLDTSCDGPVSVREVPA